MKVVLWGGFALAALLWTGMAALLTQIVEWSIRGLASGGEAWKDTAGAIWEMPAWLSPWIDPGAWAALQEGVVRLLVSVSGALPPLGNVAVWLIAAIWVAWGLGLLSLLGLTLAGAWLLRRFHRTGRSGTHAA